MVWCFFFSTEHVAVAVFYWTCVRNVTAPNLDTAAVLLTEASLDVMVLGPKTLSTPVPKYSLMQHVRFRGS
jgi:hypothetical protein